MRLTDEQIEQVRAACPVGLELRRDAVADTGSDFSRTIESVRPGTAFVTSYANGFAFGIDVAAFAEKNEALLTVLTLRAVPDLCNEILALRKQTALDAESRKASQEEFARLNRERNDAECRVADLSLDLRDANRRLREMGVALDEARDELARRDSDVAHARNDIGQLRRELNEARARIDILRAAAGLPATGDQC